MDNSQLHSILTEPSLDQAPVEDDRVVLGALDQNLLVGPQQADETVIHASLVEHTSFEAQVEAHVAPTSGASLPTVVVAVDSDSSLTELDDPSGNLLPATDDETFSSLTELSEEGSDSGDHESDVHDDEAESSLTELSDEEAVEDSGEESGQDGEGAQH